MKEQESDQPGLIKDCYEKDIFKKLKQTQR